MCALEPCYEDLPGSRKQDRREQMGNYNPHDTSHAPKPNRVDCFRDAGVSEGWAEVGLAQAKEAVREGYTMRYLLGIPEEAVDECVEYDGENRLSACNVEDTSFDKCPADILVRQRRRPDPRHKISLITKKKKASVGKPVPWGDQLARV